jgi:hypothetical protein
MCFRYLKIFDKTNFTTDLIDKYFNDVTLFIFNKYSKSIEDNYVRPTRDADLPRQDLGPEAKGQEQACEIDEYTLMLYKQLQEEHVEVTLETETLMLDTQLTDLKAHITELMKQYRKDCEKMDMMTWLDEHGNKKYEMEKKNNPNLLFIKISQGTDAGYTSQFFDVLQWWKIVGENKYGELAVAASIFLGKPSHNGFQERVFSRGTYTDTKLKKRLKEENFEMSVLNAFNGKRIDNIKEKLKVESNWNSDININKFVPNKTQARDLIKFFKVTDKTPDDMNTVNTETAVNPVPPNDDDTISEGSEVPFLDGDDDDSSLEEFLNSNAFLEEKNVPDDNEIVTVNE